MKVITRLVVCLIFSLNSVNAETVTAELTASIDSEVLGEDRPLQVYLPPSYHLSNRHYPVIYLLDGDVHRFKGFTGVLEALSTDTLEKKVKEAIVIAIPNTNRSRDLTPST